MMKKVFSPIVFLIFLVPQYLFSAQQPVMYAAAQPTYTSYYNASTKTNATHGTGAASLTQNTYAYVTPAANASQAAYAPLQLTITPEEKDELRAEYMTRGDEYFKVYNYDEAIRYYYTAVRIEENYIRGWKQMAFCYYMMKKHKYAYTMFKKVLSLDPDDKDAKEFMDFYTSLIEKSQRKPVKREAFDSAWRSAVLPGWGQIYNNQILKGLLVGSGFLISAVLTVYDVADERSKYSKYETANENLDIAYSSAQDAYNAALTFGIITAVVWIGGMVDAGINYNCDEARAIDVSYKNNTVFLCETIHF